MLLALVKMALLALVNMCYRIDLQDKKEYNYKLGSVWNYVVGIYERIVMGMSRLCNHRSLQGESIRNYLSTVMRILTAVFILLVLIEFSAKEELAYADANSQVNVVVDYLEEIITVTPGTGASTKFYISTDKMRSWEVIESKIDISSLLASKEVPIYFRGNKDQNPKLVTLQTEDNSLKVSYKVVNGIGHIEFIASQPVEFRKGSNGTWKPAVNMVPTSMYEIKGATLYFRTVATTAKRPGKIMTLKVPKRPSPPSVKLDGSKLYISGLKQNSTQYRVGDNIEWTPFMSSDGKARTLDLTALLGGNTSTNLPIPAGVVEFRTLGSDKKATSAVKVIEIPQQAAAPPLVNITGTTLTIQDPDKRKYYEYTRIEKNTVFDMAKAKWSPVTAKNAVIIPRVAVGDKILVRVKSTTDKISKQVIPASLYREFTITDITLSNKR